MKHISPARVTIAMLLLACGFLTFTVIRQRSALADVARYREHEQHNDLAGMAMNIYTARGNVPAGSADLTGPRASPRYLTADLHRAAAELEKAEIRLRDYMALLRREQDLPYTILDSSLFDTYAHTVRGSAPAVGSEEPLGAEQIATLAAVHHDLQLFEDAVNAQFAQSPPPGLLDSVMAISPTLKLDQVRRELGLFPSIAPQQETSFGLNHLSLTLSAPTTCAEVGQPVTFTLELEHLGPGQPPIALQLLEIAISGNNQEDGWSAVDAEDGLTLEYGETRAYEWIWTAGEEFRDTTVLVEARATQPTADPPPTPDPNGGSQDNPTTADLKLGIGALTQTREDQMSLLFVPAENSTRTLPCAQMVR